MGLRKQVSRGMLRRAELFGAAWKYLTIAQTVPTSSIRCLYALAAFVYGGVALAETQPARGIWQWPWGGGYFFSVAEVCAADAALPAWSYWVNVYCHSVVQEATTGTYKVHACNPQNPSACSDTPRTSSFTYACPPNENWTLSGSGAASVCTRPDTKDNGPTCPSLSKPIAIGTGNKWLAEVDLAGNNSLRFVRTYNSNPGTIASAFGKTWRSIYSQFIGLGFPTAIWLYRPDGKSIKFLVSGTTYTADADIKDRLYQETNASGALIGYRLETADQFIERYDLKGRLTSLTDISGQTQTLLYDAQNRLLTVTDPIGRQLIFTYDTSNRVSTLTDPAGNVTAYAYDANNNLVSVTYPGGSIRRYHYENATFKNALTGITDENAVRYITYTYDSTGRATGEVLAGGVESNQLSFGTNSTTVTDPLGTQRTYNFTTILSVVKSTGQSQPGGSGCGPAASAVTYDPNGNISSRTDFNGRKTTYTYDLSRNLETQRVEGLSNSGAALPETRTITTQWHPTWRLPTRIEEYPGSSATGTPIHRSTYTYDERGNLTDKVESDPVIGSTRSWHTSYTYSTAVPGLILQKIDDGPRTDVPDTTTSDYYPHDQTCAGAALGTGRDKGCRGQLKRSTNALGLATQLTRYNAHGQLEEMIDPNGVVTTLTYDPRQRLTSKQVGTETTTYQYDGVGQLLKVTLPDNSHLDYTYDPAHRLTDIADGLGNHIHYTLDAMGNRTKEDVLDPTSTLTKTQSKVYDALNRLSQMVGGM